MLLAVDYVSNGQRGDQSISILDVARRPASIEIEPLSCLLLIRNMLKIWNVSGCDWGRKGTNDPSTGTAVPPMRPCGLSIS